MAFPKTFDALKGAGYRFDNHAICRECGADIEWWFSPSGKKIPMDSMERGSDLAIPHFSTCSEEDSFRK